MKMLELNQLSLSQNLIKEKNTKENLIVQSGDFNTLILTLAINNPLWRFVVTRLRFNKIERITVHQHGEAIGYIGWDYFRGDWGFAIGNDRIEKVRHRVSEYRTHDLKKALTAIKKSFSPKNVGERISHAVQCAERVVRDQAWEKNRTYGIAKNNLNEKLNEFVETVDDQFQTYLRNRNEFHLYEKAQEAQLEMNTLKDLQTKLGICSIVVQVDGGYIVKTGDKVEMMDDTTLPHNMKAKLGMLKLVENEHFITNIGGKVQADIFVLTPEEGEGK